MNAAAAPASILVRPQPVGIFGPPASFLLLPEAAGAASTQSLLAGGAETGVAEWRFYGLAVAGQLEQAFHAITGGSLIARYNRFVLQPEAPAYRELRQAVGADLAVLLDCAAYACGVIEQPAADPGDLTGELRALALLTIASWHLERDREEEANAALEQAVESARTVSPLFAAQLLHQLGGKQRYLEAIALAGDSPLRSFRAELWLNLGTAWQQEAAGRRGPLLEAAKAFQEAIRAGDLSLTHLPELYALAHNHLALAFLMVPARDASDQLRMGIAVQSLREALKVLRPDTHPEMWSTAQLNLANALQYLPTSHPEENLQQAVNLYEELLQVRTSAKDPLGYARLLANQANALAHLGIFQPALEKLNEAHKLFHWHGEPEMAASALELVAEINSRIGGERS